MSGEISRAGSVTTGTDDGSSEVMPEGAGWGPWLMLLGGWLALLLAGWVLGELCQRHLTEFDLNSVRNVTSSRSAGLTWTAQAFSTLASGYFVTPLALLVCLYFSQSGRRHEAIAVAVSVAGAFAISTLVKVAVGRPRPPVEHLEAVASASFPSGHTTTAAAFYFALLLVFLATEPRRFSRWLAVAGAEVVVVGVGLSRIYLGVHYPSDVIAGLFIGATWSFLVTQLLRRS